LGKPATELTDSVVATTSEEVASDSLPALAFRLLFRFQGAEARGHALACEARFGVIVKLALVPSWRF
jgi:hypothetical protein